MGRRIAGIAGLVVASSMAVSLQAQDIASRSHTTGLLIGFGAESNVIGQYPGAAPSRDSNTGGQMLTIGYGFTPTWALYAQIGRGYYKNSEGGTDWAGSADLAVRRHFRATTSRFVPFALAGVSSRTLASLGTSPTRPGATYNGLSSSTMPNVGAGANMYLARSVALTTSASMNVGRFYGASDHGSRQSSVRVTTPRLSLGVLVAPGAWLKK
jgi:hypothetical protein